MYNNIFQKYINKMIGGTSRVESAFENLDMMIVGNSYGDFQWQTNEDLEHFYPELYKLLYPMIRTACMKNTKPITEELIDEMVKDIYSNFHSDETGQTPAKNKEGEADKIEKPNNFVLNDLIRILLIRELLGRPRNMLPIL